MNTRSQVQIASPSGQFAVDCDEPQPHIQDHATTQERRDINLIGRKEREGQEDARHTELIRQAWNDSGEVYGYPPPATPAFRAG